VRCRVSWGSQHGVRSGRGHGAAFLAGQGWCLVLGGSFCAASFKDWDADPLGGHVRQPGAPGGGVGERALIAFCQGRGYLWVQRLPSYLLDGVSGDRVT